MKKLYSFLFVSLCVVFVASGQKYYDSDGHIIIPDPDRLRDSCHCKLIDFRMPCCITTPKRVADIAELYFAGKPCKVTFEPENLDPSNFHNYPPAPYSDAPGWVPKPGTSIPPIMKTPLDSNVAEAAFLNHSERKVWVAARTCDTTLYTLVSLVNSKPMSKGFTFNFGQIAQAIKDLKQVLDKGRAGVSPCIIYSKSKEPSLGFTVESNLLCCDLESVDKEGIPQTLCTKIAKKGNFNVDWGVGFDCHFPVLGVPYIASLDLVAHASIALSVNFNQQTVSCSGKERFCIDAGIKAEVGAGIGATVLAGAIKASLTAVVGASANGQLCVWDPVTLCGNVSYGEWRIVGKVLVFWGFFEFQEINQVFYQGKSKSFCIP